MARLVPASRSGRGPRPMAGTSPAMTMKVTPKADPVSCQEQSDEAIPNRMGIASSLRSSQ